MQYSIYIYIIHIYIYSIHIYIYTQLHYIHLYARQKLFVITFPIICFKVLYRDGPRFTWEISWSFHLLGEVNGLSWVKPTWLMWLWINTYENTIFNGMNIHKSQLFWCELQGYKGLTHCHVFFPVLLSHLERNIYEVSSLKKTSGSA